MWQAIGHLLQLQEWKMQQETMDQHHANAIEGLETFYQAKIHVAKGEAATSVNYQPYDQQQAKADKTVSREYLGIARSK
eukprot:1661349-Ditylum_brightwellii.AAC.1